MKANVCRPLRHLQSNKSCCVMWPVNARDGFRACVVHVMERWPLANPAVTQRAACSDHSQSGQAATFV